ncbi:MAG TPA: hypothetical protein QKA14_01495 [Candidatus Megaira endosymbiont of Hartmannula sinica]|nr:hypothetical protein [Candidatus Megaera endosymbiont of Hartmannula sinica]
MKPLESQNDYYKLFSGVKFNDYSDASNFNASYNKFNHPEATNISKYGTVVRFNSSRAHISGNLKIDDKTRLAVGLGRTVEKMGVHNNDFGVRANASRVTYDAGIAARRELKSGVEMEIMAAIDSFGGKSTGLTFYKKM